MSSSQSYDQLVAELSRLHHQALGHDGGQLSESDSTSCDSRSNAIYAVARARFLTRKGNSGFPRARWRITGLYGLGFATLVLLAPVALYRWQSAKKVALAPAPNASAHQTPLVGSSASSTALTTAALPGTDPCLHREHADGKQPLVDDFEHRSPVIVRRDGRVGFWGLFFDNVPPSANLPIVPELRPQPLPNNRYAMHAAGGELRNWGAVLEVRFQPGCYDASAYKGVAFSALGPGRIYVGVRETRTVPVQWGGTCTSACYDAHQKKVELTNRWHRFKVDWDDLHQRSYDAPALDPTRINSIAFQIQPGDTPFNIWVDDVAFIPR